jgi:hypothetical protein
MKPPVGKPAFKPTAKPSGDIPSTDKDKDSDVVPPAKPTGFKPTILPPSGKPVFKPSMKKPPRKEDENE